MPDHAMTAIRHAIADVIGEVVEGLRAGVRIPSVNPSVEGGTGEGAFQQFFAGLLDGAGCRVESWEPDGGALADRFPQIRELLRPEGFRGRPNVIAWLPTDERPDGRHAHLILNSHADTVGPGDHAAWRFPPFAASLDDGHVHGLGAVDAKGALFTFLGAVMALRRAGIRLQRARGRHHDTPRLPV